MDVAISVLDRNGLGDWPPIASCRSAIRFETTSSSGSISSAILPDDRLKVVIAADLQTVKATNLVWARRRK